MPVRLTLFAALMLLTAPALAQESKQASGVVELFTSQGCNSCPKADAVLGDLARTDETLVALSYHIDYWDYRGWRDTLATPDNTERQREYVKALDSRSIYTPQAVINGRAHVNGADKASVQRELSMTAAKPQVPVTIRRENDILAIEVGGSDKPQTAKVVLVTYDAATPVKIERGENAGKTVVYWNSVRNTQTTGMWHGQKARFEIPISEVVKKGNGGCAVLIQAEGKDGGPGAILGSATLGLGNHAVARN